MAAPILKYDITFTLDIGTSLNFSQLCDITDNTEYRDMLSIEARARFRQPVRREYRNLIVKLNNWCSPGVITKEDLVKIRNQLFPSIKNKIECRAEHTGGTLNFEGSI